ncbi:MAG: uracil-DNA glycosylase [Magnetococcales bacterium]|nr:uracil-DNA glycosylase [Magnetococcales bacterium]
MMIILQVEVAVINSDELVATLEYWQLSGIDVLSGDSLEYSGLPAFIPVKSGAVAGVGSSFTQNTSPPLPKRAAKTTKPAPTLPKPETLLKSSADEPLIAFVEHKDRPEQLVKLQAVTASCQRCELHLTRKQAVFGVGSPTAPVVFVGEGPGADEDRLGEPFVGDSGKLLDKMFHSIGFKREDIYIANVVKCRPPGNRNPLHAEIALCQNYLIDQLQIIRPKAIFCLGKFALLCLLGYDGPVGKARGQSFSWRGIPVIASFHPAYYLRTPSKKNAGWQDLLKLQKLLQELDK